MTTVGTWFKQLARRAGFDLRRYGLSYDGKTERYFAQHGINLVLDVGAHIGNYARRLRELGYAGRLVSFEPMHDAFAQLQARAHADPQWTAVKLALGAEDGRATLNVSGTPMSSSLLEMLPAHRQAAPASAYVATEAVEVRALDSVFSQYYRAGDKVFVKLDTQGYEMNVLAGAARSLPSVVGLQTELAFVPLYGGEASIGQMLEHLGNLGFSLRALTPAFEDAHGRLLQADALFFREPA